MTRPWSSTRGRRRARRPPPGTAWSAARSSRRRRARGRVPHVVALGRVQAGGRLVEEDHGRPADEAGGEIEPPRMPPSRSARGGRRPRSRPTRRAALGAVRPALGEVEQPGDQGEVLRAGQLLVDRRVLPGQADRGVLPRAWRRVGPRWSRAGVGIEQVARMRTAVVLPAPFGRARRVRCLGGPRGRCRRAPGSRRSAFESFGLDGNVHLVSFLCRSHCRNCRQGRSRDTRRSLTACCERTEHASAEQACRPLDDEVDAERERARHEDHVLVTTDRRRRGVELGEDRARGAPPPGRATRGDQEPEATKIATCRALERAGRSEAIALSATSR